MLSTWALRGSRATRRIVQAAVVAAIVAAVALAGFAEQHGRPALRGCDLAVHADHAVGFEHAGGTVESLSLEAALTAAAQGEGRIVAPSCW